MLLPGVLVLVFLCLKRYIPKPKTMKIIYWHNQGRIGNLFFQYAKLLELAEKKTVIVICFYNNLFDLINSNNNFIVIKLPRFIHSYANRAANLIASKLSKSKFISNYSPKNINIKENHLCESQETISTKGIFSNFIEFKGFFQSDELVHKIQINIDISYIKKKLDDLSTNKCKVAIHIRSTDYANWIVLGVKGAQLSKQWYEKAILILQEKFIDPEFIVFTDNIDYVLSLNFETPFKYFNGSNATEDLIAIALCDHAIISPSTFSYWASILFYKNDKIIIAPKYWAGFKSKVWYPPTIETKLFQYLEEDHIPSTN